MKFIKTKIPDVIICEPNVYKDSRGYFSETFRQDKLEEFIGYKINFCQDNESRSKKGVLRGLHYQIEPYAQTKLVRVIQGRVLDIAVDIRKDSPTYGEHISIELSADNKKQLLIPKGFAHGFIVLEDDTIFSYKVDSYYSPEHERGILYDDKEINIDWVMPKSDLIISSKDAQLPYFKEIGI